MTQIRNARQIISYLILVIAFGYVIGETLPGLLEQYSFWIDELYTVAFIQGSWYETLTQWIIPDVHPPLYFVATKIWSYVFGISELTLRGFSLIWSMATVYLLWKNWHKNKNFERFAFFILVISNPFFLYYSQEARAYSALIFLSTLFLLLSLAGREKKERGDQLFWYYFIALLLSLTHYFGFLLAFVILSIDLIEARIQLSRNKTILVLCIIAIWPITHIGYLGNLGDTQVGKFSFEDQGLLDILHAFTMVTFPYIDTGAKLINAITRTTLGIALGYYLFGDLMVKGKTQDIAPSLSSKKWNEVIYLAAIISGCLCIVFAVNQKSPVTTYRNLTIFIAPMAYAMAIILSALWRMPQKTNLFSLTKLVPLVALTVFTAVSLKISDINISHKAFSIYDYKLLAETAEKSGICSEGCFTTDYNPNSDQFGANIHSYYFSNLRLTYLDPDDLEKSNKRLYTGIKRMPIIGSMQSPSQISAMKSRFCYKDSEKFSNALSESINKKRVTRNTLPFALESDNQC